MVTYYQIFVVYIFCLIKKFCPYVIKIFFHKVFKLCFSHSASISLEYSHERLRERPSLTFSPHGKPVFTAPQTKPVPTDGDSHRQHVHVCLLSPPLSSSVYYCLNYCNLQTMVFAPLPFSKITFAILGLFLSYTFDNQLVRNTWWTFRSICV